MSVSGLWKGFFILLLSDIGYFLVISAIYLHSQYVVGISCRNTVKYYCSLCTSCVPKML